MKSKIQSILKKSLEEKMPKSEAEKRLRDISLQSSVKSARGDSCDLTFFHNERFLKDHTVFGEQVLLGVTHCSIAVEAAKHRYPGKKLTRISKLSFLSPVILRKGESASIKTETGGSGRKETFENLYTKNGEKAPVRTAMGEYHFGDLSPAQPLDIKKIMDSSGDVRDGKDIYGCMRRIRHGDSIKTLEKVYVGRGEVLGKLSLPENASDIFPGCHPALLDGAVVCGVAGMDTPKEGGSPYVPFMIKDVLIYRPLPRECFCHSRLVKKNSEILIYDILLCNEEGTVLMALNGFACKRISSQLSGLKDDVSEDEASTVGPLQAGATSGYSPESLPEAVKSYITGKIKAKSSSLKKVKTDLNFMDLGVSSNELIAIAGEIEKDLDIELYPTLFFEYKNIRELTDFLSGNFQEKVQKYFNLETVLPERQTGGKAAAPRGPAVENTRKDIAVIGMNGVFPDSENLESFWRNLEDKKNMIREIPAGHFDYRPWYSPEKEDGKLYCNQGSFIDNVDEFDAEFFNMSPREAEVVDPQLRLLLQVLYNTAEDAGHIRTIRGSRTGMFIGVCFHDYAEEMARLGVTSPYIGTGNATTMMANRPSFFFDLRGPSVAIDTACSSSLVAFHFACRALQNGECDMAFSGGANLLLTAAHYKYFCAIGALSPSGRCHTFDKRADGYVPGEGIASVLLKPLDAAIRDNDRIHAVIKGSATNHGGYTPSITAPSAKLETRVILDAWEDAGVSPETVTYIEAHGTGTKLGDPVEIRAIQAAFRQHTDKESFCAVGSAKAHIGHTEGAAGIAGVIKVILSMQNRRIPAMPDFKEINPYIKLENSSLYINREVEDWKPQASRKLRAGVNSFGFGGTYAHVVIEAYDKPARPDPVDGPGEYLVVFSAQTGEALERYAGILARYLKEHESVAMDELSYSLLSGKDFFDHRAAIVASDIPDLLEKLSGFPGSNGSLAGVWHGGTDTGNEEQLPEAGSEDRHKLGRWARRWVNGGEIDPDRLYPGEKPCRMTIPGYPFARERYWIPEEKITLGQADAPSATPDPHPFIIAGLHAASHGEFIREFHSHDDCLKDHNAGGNNILPGVFFLEMACAAGRAATGNTVELIRDIVWSHPVQLNSGSRKVYIRLHTRGNETAFEVSSRNHENRRIPHAQGQLLFGVGPISEEGSGATDIAAIAQRCPARKTRGEIYAKLEESGLKLGPSLRVVNHIRYSDREILSEIQLPETQAAGAAGYLLNPQVLDGALQSLIAFEAPDGGTPLFVPYAIKGVRILGRVRNKCYAHISVSGTERRNAGDTITCDITLYEPGGRKILEMKEYMMRPLLNKRHSGTAGGAAAEPAEPACYVQQWRGAGTGFDLSPETELWEGMTAVLQFVPEAGCAFFSRGQRIRNIIILPGEEFRKKDETTFEINPGLYDDYLKLFSTLVGQKEFFPDTIIHHWSLAGKDREADLSSLLALGPYSLVFITRALDELNDDRPVRFICLNGAGPGRLKPVFSALPGLLKTIRAEYPRYTWKTLEARDGGFGDAMLLNEIRKADGKGVEVLYKGNIRFVRELVEAAGPGMDDGETPADAASLKQDGVYLITGGLGGLGQVFSKYLAEKVGANLILVGRSSLTPEKESKIREIENLGARVRYLRADISRRSQVAALISEIKKSHPAINGILHCAGITRDSYLKNKTADDIAEVLAPKVFGTVNLDEATKDEPLDFFMMFSSVVSVFGNAGQSDYAYANGFLDQYALYREELRRDRERSGRSIAVNWPLWRDGGMKVDDETNELIAHMSGMELMTARAGLQAFEKLLALHRGPVLVAARKRNEEAGLSRTDSPEPGEDSPAGSRIYPLREDLVRIVQKILKIKNKPIDFQKEIMQIGFDSIALTEFANALNKRYGLRLTPPIFFEYNTLDRFTAYLETVQAGVLEKHYSKQPAPGPRPPAQDPEAGGVAVIGMSCIMPLSDDIREFWENLCSGKNLVSEIPPDRWDWREYYGDPGSGANRTWVKSGGFMRNVYGFDAEFFNISAREAVYMDPQQRLFLETVWHTIEHAGYRPADLSGTKTGLFVGVSTLDYSEILKKSDAPNEAHAATGTSNSILPNRISFLLNLKGPSEPVNTACSSSLVAIARGVEAIKSGNCEMAIAGGVNAILNPDLFIAFSKAGMLSPDGKCKAFDQSADGYARGEGVGAVLLKPLEDAIRDADHIYGIIKGVAVGHGGKANSITTPNPGAQSETVRAAYESAGVDMGTVSYIEAHGTGTKLGDPAEINGLKKAFRHIGGKAFCGIGAVKSNLGHLEAAAGMAGMIKVLLAMKHKVLPASIHLETINPYIELEGTPFYFVSETRPWDALAGPDGRPVPRRAGVSSFGFGGVNAHIVVEESDTAALRSKESPAPAEAHPVLFLLSARTNHRLKEYARQFVTYLDNENDPELRSPQALYDVAYTAQVGRDPMKYRLAFAVDSLKDIKNGLQDYIDGKENPAIFSAVAGASGDVPGSGGQEVREAIAEKRLETLARIWVRGGDVSWEKLWDDMPVKRTGLPTYPFEKRSYRIDKFPRTDNRQDALTPTASTGPGASRKLVLKNIKAATSDRNPKPAGAPDARETVMLNRIAPKDRERKTEIPHKDRDQLIRDIKSHLASVLFIEAGDVPEDKVFVDMGLDSVLGIELINKINISLGEKFKATLLYENPTVEKLAEYLLREQTPGRDVDLAPEKTGKGAGSGMESGNIPELEFSFHPPEPAGAGKILLDCRLDPSGSNCLTHHVVFGRRTLPTDGYIEMIHAAAKTAFDDSFPELADLRFFSPLVCLEPGGAVDVRVEFKTRDRITEFIVKSRSAGSDAGFEVHVTGTLNRPNPKPDRREVEYRPPADAYQHKVGKTKIYRSSPHYHFGTFYQTINELLITGDAAVCILKSSGESRIQTGIYLTHPGIINGLIVSALYIANGMDGREDRLYIPVSLERASLYGELKDDETYFGYIRRTGETSGEPCFDLDLFAGRNTLLMALNGLRLKAVTAGDLAGHEGGETGKEAPATDRGMSPGHTVHRDMAVIGMSGRFPLAGNTEAFWNNLASGLNCITPVPPGRWESNHGGGPVFGGFLDDIDQFDCSFFNISPLEAESMDPQQRVFLSEAWHAFEDAGYSMSDLSGKKCGVFVGAGYSGYGEKLKSVNAGNSGHMFTGLAPSILAARISYFLDLKGPSMTIDTACSSSLVAVCQACQSIMFGDCDMALAGGVVLMLNSDLHARSLASGMLSPRDTYKIFDAQSEGIILGEGAGVVLIKPLDRAVEDRDHIYGVIKGFGSNQDGKTNGITAPSSTSQVQLLRDVYERAAIDPATVSHVETHGTGTPLGDPIELEALRQVYRGKSPEPLSCALGSVKANIGHGSMAAGIASLMKVLLSLKHKKIPPLSNFETLNPGISMEGSPFYINRDLRRWETPGNIPRRAGVSSFGFSGTNCHLILEEAPLNKQSHPATPEPFPYYFIFISARTDDALKRKVGDLVDFMQHLAGDADILDISYTLLEGRDHFQKRLAFIVKSPEELLDSLKLFRAGSVPGNCRTGREDPVGIAGREDPVGFGNRIILELGTAGGDPAFDEKAFILADLYAQGADLDWNPLFEGRGCKRVPLPAYPFSKERYWIPCGSPTPPAGGAKRKPAADKPNQDTSLYLAPSFKERSIPLSDTETGISGNILLLGPDEDINRQIISRLEGLGCKAVLVLPGEGFREIQRDIFRINPGQSGDYVQLLETFNRNGFRFQSIIHLWTRPESGDAPETIDRCLVHGFFSLFYLVRAMMRERCGSGIRLACVYRNRTGEATPHWEALGGFLKTLSLEKPDIGCKKIEFRDNGENSLPEAALVDLMLAELGCRNAPELEIRYTGEKRHVKYLEEIPRPSGPDNPSGDLIGMLKENGTYIIAGGAGGLGLIFAGYLAARANATIILLGRSVLTPGGQSIVEEMNGSGSRVIYRRADISDIEDLKRVITQIKEDGSRINGIIHSAGLLKDAFIMKKRRREIDRVFEPKIYGTLHLDELTKDEPLDFFLLFSSIAAETGNIGQSDYAYANMYLNAWAEKREALRKRNKRSGLTKSVSWPFWTGGGMEPPEDDLARLAAKWGVTGLPAEEGINALNQSLWLDPVQVVVVYGDAARIRKQFISDSPSVDEKQDMAPRPAATPELIQKTVFFLMEEIAKIIKIPVESLDPKTDFEAYGLDSVIISRFNERMEACFGALPKTILYEYQNVQDLARYFTDNHSAKLAAHFGMAPQSASPVETETRPVSRVVQGEGTTAADGGDIAIIGLSGRYPMAENIDVFWENLKAGRDCVTEAPLARWDFEEFYSSDPGNSEGKSCCKWGGFLDEIDKFDPLFFKISPKEAQLMDPQERLFLETAWAVFEDAGYTRKRLKKKYRENSGGHVGVFVGATTFSYQLFGPDEWRKGNMIIPTSMPWSIANRVSYVMELQGPSITVDTACSSSLTAIHLAKESILRGECSLAIAGGVNVYTHYSKYIGLSQMQMLSPTGKCRSFGDAADGFVPGEGVGAILLKPLAAAVRDSDRIYGVIKGSALNHGGKTNNYTVPNPVAQAELILRTLEKAGVDPGEISCLEAHGTGTSLGDPIEISGLAGAFRERSPDTDIPEKYCSLGSVKSNIGHLEAAAGIAGVTKVLLQLKYRQLVPTLHSKQVNANLDLSGTPFYLQHDLAEWSPRKAGRKNKDRVSRRRAGVSSFGAGGSNAHLILEEYTAPDLPGKIRREEMDEPRQTLVVLSAKSERELESYTDKLLAYCRNGTGDGGRTIDLQSLAYTLQTGREAMQSRVGFLVSSSGELVDLMQKYRDGTTGGWGIFTGNAKKNPLPALVDGEEGREFIVRLARNGKLSEIAELWMMGVDVEWGLLYPDNGMRVISLPTYPFSGETCWVPVSSEPDSQIGSARGKALHPFIDENISGLDGIKFATRLTGAEFYLTNHKVGGQSILPGVAYLEMALAASRLAGSETGAFLEEVSWETPIVYQREKIDVDTNLALNGDGDVEFTISTRRPAGHDVVHARGKVRGNGPVHETSAPGINPDQVMERCRYRIPGPDHYSRLERAGFGYGPCFQSIDRILFNDREALALLRIPGVLKSTAHNFTLHPSLMDGAFQAASCLSKGAGSLPKGFYLPFMLGRVTVYADDACQARWAHVTLPEKSSGSVPGIRCFDIVLADPAGRVLIGIEDFVVKMVAPGRQKQPLVFKKRENTLKQLLEKIEKGEISAEAANQMMIMDTI